MKQPPDRMTMKQLAEALGISRTTVSLVLKGQARKYRIRDDTAQKILQAVHDSGYRPNYFATALNLRRSGVVGVVFPNVFEAFMSETVKGIEDVTHAAEYTAMIATSRFDQALEQKVIAQMLHRGVDGIIIACNAPFRGAAHRYDHIRRLCRGPAPVVMVDRIVRGIDCHAVLQDDSGGAQRATEQLLRAGCCRPCFLSLDLDVSSIRERRRGFLAALKRAGIHHTRCRDILLKKRDPESHDLRDALAALMRGRAAPDCFFITTSGLANRARFLLAGMGISVPADVAIARFGSDPPWNPSGMICVEQPHVDMGRRAARMLLHLLNGSQPAGPRCQTVPVSISTAILPCP